MQPELTTTTSSGGQTSTQSPQSAAQGSGAGYSAPSTGNLQSDSSLNGFTALSSSNGINLQPPALPSVNLSAAASSATIQRPSPTPPAHHINGPLLGVSALLFIAAVLVFAQTFRSANNTTD